MDVNDRKEAILTLLAEFYKAVDYLTEPGRKALKTMEISLYGEWKIRPHGIGICATNIATAEIVDFDFVYHREALVFDEYKFAAYLESKYPKTSILITVFSQDSAKRQQEYFDSLKCLAEDGVIGEYSGIVSGYYLKSDK